MDYEKAYKDALAKAREIHRNEGEKRFDMEWLFPKLAESEDERIRKELIQFIKNWKNPENIKRRSIDYPLFTSNEEQCNKYISWLEKQESVREIVERCKNSWYNEGKIDGMAEGLTEDEKYQQGWHDALEKQDEQKKDICEGCNNYKGCVTCVDGDQWAKITKVNIKPKFHEGDWIINPKTGNINQIKNVLLCENGGNYEFEKSSMPIKSTDRGYRLWDISDAKDGDVLVASDGSIFLFAGVDDCACKYYFALTTDKYIKINKEAIGGYWETSRAVYPATKEQRDILFAKMKETGYKWDAEKKELKKIEQKPIDKIEPKFKVGDWVVNNDTGGIYQVTEITDDKYCLWSLHNTKIVGYLRIIDVDNDYHLWTIKDAKDGDILVCEDNMPFIFKGFDRFHPECPVAYCGIDENGYFIVNTGDGWWTDEKCYPATKEQCNFLFQKMHEAGYEWDSEKKELKKIEHWSEVDERIYYSLLADIRTRQDGSTNTLKAYYNEQIDWLKSLKERCAWKPSDEQLEILKDLIEDNNQRSFYPTLKSLYDDLEKLK